MDLGPKALAGHDIVVELGGLSFELRLFENVGVEDLPPLRFRSGPNGSCTVSLVC